MKQSKILLVLCFFMSCVCIATAQDGILVGADMEHRDIYELPTGARYYVLNGERHYISSAKKESARLNQYGLRSSDRIIGVHTNGLVLYETPLNGQYYLNANNQKWFVIDNKNPKFFAPKGTIKNSGTYDKATLVQIKAAEAKMGQSKSFGGLEGTSLHLTAGSIFFYKTSKDNFGKLQIIGFGRKGDIQPELYIRWTTYDKKKGKIIKSLEYDDLFSEGQIRDLDASAFPGWDFKWNVENELLLITDRSGAQFHLLQEGEFESIPTTAEAKPQPTEKTENLLSSATIRWTHSLNNNAVTNNATFKITACVETNETINEYLLMRNGQKLSVPRGLIPRQDNDCLNYFSNTVTLKEGENQYELIVKTSKGVVKSETFKIRHDPKAIVEQKMRRLALVIGNGAYEYAKPLPNPTNDATDMATVLRDIGFEVITATNADLRKMNEKLDEFSEKLKDYDIGLFYYAGHGLQVGGANYLVPVNAKPKTEGEVSLDCFSVARVLARMEAVRNRANLIILDACRDNPLSRSLVFREVGRGSADPGLARIDAHAGTLIGFATAAGATAADGTNRNGTYTEALLKHLRNPNLSVVQLFTAVSGTVQTATDKKQVPWINSSLSEDLYLTK